MNYIILESRPDRLGSNITMYIAQILYAHKNCFYIRYDISKLKYSQSWFITYLIKLIDLYNEKLPRIAYDIYDPFILGDWSQQIGNTTRLIKTDHIYKFKQFITELNINDGYMPLCPYIAPFDGVNTILVHLRLDDVENLPEISGKESSDYYTHIMNSDKPIFHMNTSPFFNQQSPLSIQTIQRQIDIVSKKYPEKEVIIVTNPSSSKKLDLPYRIICSDENTDLYILTLSKVIILSRSTFSLSSLYFGNHDEVYIPLIGFLVMFGLRTKFEKSNYIYF